MSVYTSTSAFSRNSLMTLQIINMLNDAAFISESTRSAIRLGMSKQYFSDVVVEGVLRSGRKGAELRVSIDWRMHAIKLGAGDENIRAPQNWPSGYSPSMKESVDYFNIACKEGKLKRHWFVTYNKAFSAEKIDRELGFKPCEAHTWNYKPVSDIFGFGPLEEMQLRVSFAL